MADPNVPPSDEVIAQTGKEALFIGTDWETRHQVNAAGFRGVSKALKDATDPHELSTLKTLKDRVSAHTLGSLALQKNKEATLIQRRAFESLFGDQQ